MVVAVARIEFLLSDIRSLKEKRSVLRRLVDRTQNQFNAAVAEVDSMDEHRSAVIGVAVVSNDRRHANTMIDEIAGFLRGMRDASVTEVRSEVISVGSMLGQPQWPGAQ